MKDNEAPYLKGKEINDQVFEKLSNYDKLNFFEQYAMFMGKSQILEFGLKNLLTNKFGLDSETMESWTLGRIKNEMERQGIRGDFINLLKNVIEYRNYIAHEILANQTIIMSLVSSSNGRFETKRLRDGIFELEKILILFYWCQEHDSWK